MVPKLTSEYVKGEIEKYGGKLLGEYVGSLENVDIVCVCGHIRTTLYWRFASEEDSHLCKECSKNWKNLTTEYVRNELEKIGCKLIGEYVDSKTYITVECLCGHRKQTKFHTFISSDSTHLCENCSPANTYGLKTEFVRSVVEHFGSVMVGEYIPSKEIQVICPACGKTYSVNFNSFRNPERSHLCRKCSPFIGADFIDKDELMQRFFDNGFLVVDRNEIHGMEKKIDLVDEEGYKYHLSMYGVQSTRRINGKIEKFSSVNPFTLYNMNLWVQKEGKEIDVLSISKDKTNRLQVEIYCRRCGNKRTLSWSSVNSKGNGCSYCSISKGERKIKYFLEQHNISFTFQKKYDDCKDKIVLRFDFHLWDYNTIVEYDGEGHFEPRDFKGKGEEWAIDQFNQTQRRDRIKTQYCLDHNIPILRIPYWQKDNIPQILTSYLHLDNSLVL